jgi:hypothetical protein
MTWENILKVDEYVREKLNEYRKKLKAEKDPEERKKLERRIKYYEDMED